MIKIIVICLSAFIINSAYANFKYPQHIYKISKTSNSTNSFIELPKTIKLKYIKDRLSLIRSTKKRRKELHSFKSIPTKDLPGTILSLHTKNFTLKMSNQGQMSNDIAVMTINYEVISGHYKHLNAGDKFVKIFTYDLSEDNKLKYEVSYSINGEEPILVKANYKP